MSEAFSKFTRDPSRSSSAGFSGEAAAPRCNRPARAPLVRGLAAFTFASVAIAALSGCPAPSDNSDGAEPNTPTDGTDVADGGSGGPVGEPVIQSRSLTDVRINPTIPAQPRKFMLGAVAVGAAGEDFSDADLEAAIQRVSENSECIVVRPLIDWEYFRPGGTDPTSIRLNETVAIVASAKSHGLQHSLIQLDPIANRSTVSPLPAALTGQDFGDESVREAVRGMTVQTAQRIQPTYLSVGVEVNGYLDANPQDFENLVTLHKELYDEIKVVSPDTKVALSLHYETLLRMTAGPGQADGDEARRALIARFEPQVDVLALSSLPWPSYSNPNYLPLDYVSRVEDFTDLPIILSEIAWTTDPGSGGNEQEQVDYLAIMARAAMEAPQVELVAWAFLTDPLPGTILDEIPSFTRIGLFSSDGVAKPAYALWQDLHARSWQP